MGQRGRSWADSTVSGPFFSFVCTEGIVLKSFQEWLLPIKLLCIVSKLCLGPLTSLHDVLSIVVQSSVL